ncbi:NADP dehydrogenase [ubiquinone] 1 alpha subcomplex assembly factor 4 [Plakobranchus ocellatus]|uniref:NADP dehydrogenase [ubiquinone] 1 alpha subcomplex assembly factor 4 n=1 Tax=Plakobranchus ocellatus TaxID=259542 RepID=A0AAV4AK76_9GAST|nr:NADP dehydrogenase [ubiquinone] 1 alpha subcomplex assembly factor 4 [Plakobranchus ocellatus]
MGGRITRPIRNINIENRAAKALDRQKKAPKAAPKHATTVDKLSQMQQEHPEFLSDVENKNERLHERLKHIYIDSKDPPITIKSSQPAPQLSRRALQDRDLGVMDVEGEVPQGRSSLKSLMAFISSHQENPTQHSAAAIAEEHHLDEAAVQNVLAHFRVMQLHIPKEMYKENKNMNKIVAEQLKKSKGIAASFKLEEGKAKEPLKSISGKTPATDDSNT